MIKMGDKHVYKGFLIFLFLKIVYGAETKFCITGEGFDRHIELCEWGCCEDECCPNMAAIIAGAVIGGLIFLALLILCIVCICCACQNKKGPQHAGRTIQPANTTAVHTTTTPYSHPPPPAYNQFSAFPPSSSDRHPPPSYNQIYSTMPNSTPSAPPAYSDSAYPPGVATGGATNSGFTYNAPPPVF